jgi:hypothetical protein
MNTTRTTRIVSALSLAIGLGLGTLAATPVLAGEKHREARIEREAASSIPQLQAKLTALGYTDIGRIERDADRYDVRATTSAGERVVLRVDARNGEILRSKPDASDRGRERKRSGKQDDARTRECSERRCRDDQRVRTLGSEAIGWYLSDIYGRMKSAGL